MPTIGQLGSMGPMGQRSTAIYGGSAFPPIAEYGFLSDCESAALVAPSGNVEWLCAPRFDSPSVFGAMLDRDAGSFRAAPMAPTRQAERSPLDARTTEPGPGPEEGVVPEPSLSTPQRSWESGNGRPDGG